MSENFDALIDRRGTDCLKYDAAARRGLPEDVLPLWVADMDFAVPEGVLTALRARVEHGIFGYSEPGLHYYEALAAWMKRRHGYDVRPDWCVKTPGVVFALAMAVRACTREGDGVLIQPPVYYPFRSVILKNNRRAVEAPLIRRDGRYGVDLDDFERKITENGVRLFLLCSPHNPVGRVWTREELHGMGEICRRHGVVVCSDEIHSDIVFPGRPHTVFSNAGDGFGDFSIICTAPSKTFNLAGCQVSNIFISSPALRGSFLREVDAAGYSQLNALGLVACEAAYRTGEQWLDELLVYLRGNVDFMAEYLAENLPRLKMEKPEGTYLAWVDFRALGLSPQALEELIVRRAGLWLDVGSVFGTGGEGFERFNLACPRATLARALVQLKGAVNT